MRYKRRRNKYNARKVEAFGLKFDSKLEFERYCYLLNLEDRGEIRQLRLHPWFEIQPAFTDNTGKRWRAINYEADFEYITNDGTIIVEDTKGVETETFKVKRKMFLFHYPELQFRQKKTATEEIG